MKSLFSEGYYREHWDRFLEKVPGEHYINLEGMLNKEMALYEEAGIDDNALSQIRKIEASKIAKEAMELVKKELKIQQGLDAGTCTLGYTTQRQEISARGEFRKRFEFNCLQLSDFRRKYGI